MPVVERELRGESRRPFNYWLRVIGAGALTIVATLTLLPHSSTYSWAMSGRIAFAPGQNPYGLIGTTLFGSLNAAIFAAMWLLVPLLTADAINREKREGTLGLLFLTPLTSSGIVIGKSLVHALRALTLYFTMLPVLLMPLMLGGVTMKDGLMAALLNFGALLLALAAGLLASAWTRDWLKSVALAQFLSILFAVIFMTAQRNSLVGSLTGPPAATAVGGATTGFVRGWAGTGWNNPMDHFSGWDRGILSSLANLFALNTSLGWDRGRYIYTPAGQFYEPSINAWNEIWSATPPSVHWAWFRRSGALVLSCLGVLMLAVFVAGKSVEHGWREMPPSPKRQKVNKVLSQPVLSRGALQRRARRALERNPIGWLQQYSLNARLTKWGWCGFVIIGELVFAADWRDAWDAQFWMALTVLLGLGFSASGSFHRERETGAMELLLVTPLSAWQIIRGRLAGIRMQFLPAFATLLLAWALLVQPNWMRQVFNPDAWDHSFALLVYLFAAFTVSFLTLPIIGLYFSLHALNQIVSWLATCTAGLVIPMFLFANVDFILRVLISLGVEVQSMVPLRGAPWISFTTAFAWQLAAALLASLLLYVNLTKRRFMLN